MRVIVVVPRQDSVARVRRAIHPRKQHAGTKPIVRPGRAETRSLVPPAASPRGLLRQPTTTTGQALRTAGIRMNRRGRSAIHRPITTIAALRIAGVPTRRRDPSVIHRPTTITAAIRNRALTARRQLARTQRLGRTPRRAAAIPLRHTPTPRPAMAAVAVAFMVALAPEAVVLTSAVAAGLTAAAAAEAPTVVVLLLTGAPNRFILSTARPEISGRAFRFSASIPGGVPPYPAYRSTPANKPDTTLRVARCYMK